jgi:hypothetical protein
MYLEIKREEIKEMIKYSLEGIAEIKKNELKTISKDKILKYEL